MQDCPRCHYNSIRSRAIRPDATCARCGASLQKVKDSHNSFTNPPSPPSCLNNTLNHLNMALPEPNGKTVLITGLNGYIASTLGLHLLKKGYSLRGTSRKASSADALLKGPYLLYKDRITIYEVSDMTVDGAFDEAVQEVDGIFHTASPFNFSLSTYEQTITPARRGTETLLNSALKAGPKLTSVVVTSAVVAIVDLKEDPEYEFSERDFASFQLERAAMECQECVGTLGRVLYTASKTAAEQEVWRLRAEHKPKFSISTINPSVVIGPPILLPTFPTHLNQTLQPIFSVLSGNDLPSNIGTGTFVDVRDVADMHIWALEHPDRSDGERFIGCAGFGPIQAMADILREKYKGTKIGMRVQVGSPGQGYEGWNESTGKVDRVGFEKGRARVSERRAKEIMGFEYVGFQQSVLDTAEALEPLL